MVANPSARLKVVTLPDPWPMGYAGGDVAPPSSAVSTSPTSKYSVRPISLFTLTASLAGTMVRSSDPRPASILITGATNSWKVKMAEVGKPGSTTTARPPGAARQIGLPGLSATPCATIPGSANSETTRYDTSPAPLLVPPDINTTSANSSA